MYALKEVELSLDHRQSLSLYMRPINIATDGVKKIQRTISEAMTITPTLTANLHVRDIHSATKSRSLSIWREWLAQQQDLTSDSAVKIDPAQSQRLKRVWRLPYRGVGWRVE